MFDRVRKTLGRILQEGGAKVGATYAAPRTTPLETAEPLAYACADAHLQLMHVDDEVHFCADFAPDPMLRFSGRVDEPPSLFRGEVGGRASLRLSCSLRTPEGTCLPLEITVVSHGVGPDASLKLSRSTRRRIPPDEQAIEVVFMGDDHSEFRYLARTPLGLRPVGFREVSRQQAVFEEVPPLTHMIAFLKATVHHRRATLRSLTSMARWIEHESVKTMVAAMNEKLSPSHDFTNPVIRRLQRTTADRGLTVHPSTLAAVCLLADMVLEKLRPEHLLALAEHGTPLPTSVVGALACAGFFGASVDLGPWTQFAQETCEVLDPDDVERALAFLKASVTPRNAVTILADLADESGSERSRSRVQRLLRNVRPDQVLANDEHLALQGLLAHQERRVQLETLAALGVYVDFEAGILSEEDIDSITPRRAFVDTSLYAMMAVAAAFDVETRVFRTGESDPERLWQCLEYLVSLENGGAVARFIEQDEPGHLTLFLATPEDVRACRERGLQYIGEVMCPLPCLSHISEADLEIFEKTAPWVAACFITEEKRLQWRGLDSVRKLQAQALADEAAPGRFAYIDRYDAWRFHHRVLGHRVSVEARALVGRKNLIAVYLDLRDNPVYRHLPSVASEADVRALESQELRFGGEVVEFPGLGPVPWLIEPSHEYLLGLPDDRTLLHERLDRVYVTLEEFVERREVFVPGGPERLPELMEALQSSSLRSLLVGVVDPALRDAAVEWISTHWDGLEMAEALAQALGVSDLREPAALLVLSEVLQGSVAASPDGLGPSPTAEAFEPRVFLELLVDRVLHAADSSDADTRALACRLLGFPAFAADTDTRMAVSYVLSRFMDSDVWPVARWAGMSLAALSLREVVPGREVVCLKGTTTPVSCRLGTDELRQRLGELATEVAQFFSLSPDQHRRVVNMLGSLLPRVAH